MTSFQGEKPAQDFARAQDIRKVTADSAQQALENIDFYKLASSIPENIREDVTSGFDMFALARVFEDETLMHTIDVFIENGLNVSLTARKLYMHRNTLQYRLGVIRKITGVNLKSMSVAVSFKLLHYLYLAKRG